MELFKIKTVLFIPLVLQMLICRGQPADIAVIDRVMMSYKPQKQLLLRFVDSVQYGERKFNVNRSSFLDRVVRQLATILVLEDPNRPKNGLQIVYAFANDKLVKITYPPSRNTCMNCQAEYYFQDQQLIHKKESGFVVNDVTELYNDAQALKSNAPKVRPCGHYEVENCIHVRKNTKLLISQSLLNT